MWHSIFWMTMLSQPSESLGDIGVRTKQRNCLKQGLLTQPHEWTEWALRLALAVASAPTIGPTFNLRDGSFVPQRLRGPGRPHSPTPSVSPPLRAAVGTSSREATTA